MPTTFKEADETSSFVAANFGERVSYGGHSGQPGVANEACVHWVSGTGGIASSYAVCWIKGARVRRINGAASPVRHRSPEHSGWPRCTSSRCTRPHKASSLEALRVFRASPATIVLMRTQLKLNIRSRGAMSGVLTMGSLDLTFEAAASVDGEMVVLDLRPVEFVEPAGLCGL